MGQRRSSLNGLDPKQPIRTEYYARAKHYAENSAENSDRL